MMSSSHWSDIGKVLMKYREDDFMCDTVLITKNGEMKAHGILLAAVSSVFKTVFEQDISQGIHHLNLPETDASIVEVIIHFAYTGNLLLPFKSSQTEEVSKMMASLEGLGLDVQQLVDLEIKFAGDAEFNKSENKAALSKEAASNAAATDVDQAQNCRKSSLESNEDEVFVTFAQTPNTNLLKDAKGPERADSKNTEGQLRVQELQMDVVEADRQVKQEIILECGSDIDAHQYKAIQSILSGAAGENCVTAEHSYYSFKVSEQNVGDFEGLAIKLERTDENSCEENVEPEASPNEKSPNDKSELVQKCPFCIKNFSETQKLEHHIGEEHGGKKIFECETCNRKFSSEYNLSRHVNLHNCGRPYLCHLCGRAFIHKWLLKEHIESQHKTELVYLCVMCEMAFSTRNKLRLHMAITHKLLNNQPEEESEMQEDFETRECSNEPLSVSLDKDDSRPYLCDICGKNFKTAWSLKSHEKLHSGIHLSRQFSCPLCSKTFVHRSQVTQHMVKHTGQKPYRCSYCDKSYSQKGSLTQHIRTHTGEKPFVCQMCGKAFVIKAMLQQHCRVHTGEKPHICQTCGKGFIYKESLIVHMRIHTGEKPYSCKVCGSSYTQSHHLKGHMLTHTGEKPFTCSFCEKAYKNRVDLRYHCQRVHQVNISKRQITQVASDNKKH